MNNLQYSENRYNLLVQHFNKFAITKEELAKYVLGVSLSTVNRYMAIGVGVPQWKKLGSKEHSKVVFDLLDVANFLESNKIKIA
ncbi:helix-turn-helix transcriptional regulator [Candidatus Sulfurimonas baltica]|uniref:DNA-binding protein n=1 Tax=Candidatus Sulfurimonas baltica TaxID=2740404 RepID=A0A7S7LYN7_9BACT|nr:hypothetical protein [Candidatus Sulfurimonas baltica]QOY52999.1 hypothetical protein HUE88_04765 [Candidatus Sulfurimonas baltica]